MLVILLKRFGLGALIGLTIALLVLMVQLYVRLWDSFVTLWDSHLGVRLAEIAHAVYHTLQVELLNAHHAIHVEVRSIHHVIQVDVTRHHELWLRLNGILTFGDVLVFLGALIVATTIWTSRAISISLPVKNRQMTAVGPAWRRGRGRFSAHNARYFLPDSCYPDR